MAQPCRGAPRPSVSVRGGRQTEGMRPQNTLLTHYPAFPRSKVHRPLPRITPFPSPAGAHHEKRPSRRDSPPLPTPDTVPLWGHNPILILSPVGSTLRAHSLGDPLLQLLQGLSSFLVCHDVPPSCPQPRPPPIHQLPLKVFVLPQRKTFEFRKLRLPCWEGLRDRRGIWGIRRNQGKGPGAWHFSCPPSVPPAQSLGREG